MNCHITPVAYWYGDPPALTLKAESDTRTMSRRMSRSPTLDGSAVINDGGYSDADRSFTLQFESLTQSNVTALEAIAALGPCHCALDHGLYLGYIKDYAFNGPDSSTLTFWVTQRIA
jgi:hypothetical protein